MIVRKTNSSVGSRHREGAGSSTGPAPKSHLVILTILDAVGRPGFKARFEQRIAMGEADECWPWQGHKNPQGYGIVGVGSRPQMFRAHRLAYALNTGIDPAGLDVCHSCDNPPCCNPSHLWLGTRADNNRDKIEKGRANAPRGSSAAKARLSESDVLEIYNSKDALREIAARHGVSESTICEIWSGKNWSWLTGGKSPRKPRRSVDSESRAVQAAHLRAQGFSNRQIAERLGVHMEYVRVLCHRASSLSAADMAGRSE